MKKKFFLPLLVAAAVFTACNDEGDTTATSTTTDSTTVSSATDNSMMGDTSMNSSAAPLSEMDREFIMKAAMGGKMEVDAGNLSQSNAAHERVKAFGAMMVRDHSQANSELMGIAQAHGYMAPDSMDKKMADHMAQMQKMTGKGFDKHYMGMMVTDHDKDIALFEKVANGATAPDIKAFATKTLPILKMHKDSATAINKAVKM